MVLLTSITWISRIYFYVSILIPSLQAKNWENYSQVNNVWTTRSIFHNYPILLDCTVFVQSMIQLWINHCLRRVLYGLNCHRMKKIPGHVFWNILYRYSRAAINCISTIVTCIRFCETIKLYTVHILDESLDLYFVHSNISLKTSFLCTGTYSVILSYFKHFLISRV